MKAMPLDNPLRADKFRVNLDKIILIKDKYVSML